MRLFGGRGGNANSNNTNNHQDIPNNSIGDAAHQQQQQQPLLDRNRLNRQISNISGVSYGSVASRGGADANANADTNGLGNGTVPGTGRRRSRSHSKRRRTKIRTSVYADPPGERGFLLISQFFSLWITGLAGQSLAGISQSNIEHPSILFSWKSCSFSTRADTAPFTFYS
jgi:hypothetical protein